MLVRPNELPFGSRLDINATLDGGAVDAGVKYVVDPLFSLCASVDYATGVVTPVSPGTGFIHVRTLATDAEIGRVLVSIRPSSFPEFNTNGTRKVQIGMTPVTPPPAPVSAPQVAMDAGGQALAAPPVGFGDFYVTPNPNVGPGGYYNTTFTWENVNTAQMWDDNGQSYVGTHLYFWDFTGAVQQLVPIVSSGTLVKRLKPRTYNFEMYIVCVDVNGEISSWSPAGPDAYYAVNVPVAAPNIKPAHFQGSAFSGHVSVSGVSPATPASNYNLLVQNGQTMPYQFSFDANNCLFETAGTAWPAGKSILLPLDTPGDYLVFVCGSSPPATPVSDVLIVS